MIGEAILHKFYDGLDRGVLMGLKCKKCGQLEFPPVPFCQNCGDCDMEWIELSGKGELFLITSIGFYDEHFAELGLPYVVGSVRMPEGPGYSTIISGIDATKMEEELEKCPREVKAEIREIGGQKTVTFKVI